MSEKIEGLKQIESLIAADKLNEAYNLCNKLLLNFPESVRVKRLKAKVEKLVFKKNLNLVKEDLKKLQPLWKQQKYSEIINKLKELQKYVPGYAPLQKQLQKAQKLLFKQKSHKQEDILAQYMTKAKEYMNNANYKDAITTLKRILLKLPDHDPAKQLLKEARDSYIDQQIKERNFLLKSNKFDEIAAFIKHLKFINPDSPKITSLVNKLSKREKMARKFKKMDFTYKSYEELLTLYKKQKYKECIKGLKELVSIEKDNFKALELLESARKKFDKQLTKEVYQKIKKLQKRFKKQKKQMPKEFIRL